MRQRVCQFIDAGVQPGDEDFALAREWLAPPLLDLFAAQHPRDVVHAVRTARWLLERGHIEADLVVAALLHDAGKGRQRRFDRVAWVLAESARLGSFGASERSRLEVRRAMARSRSHSWTSAELMRGAGASRTAVRLVRFHHRASASDPVLALLQEADAAN
jgi:hypothetical protein